uniref:Coatomer_WDAD domain-containing protein n=1 Tax=Macrostomum lignano TaxID=282301 RepID=A0A1I8F311_9PLAT
MRTLIEKAQFEASNFHGNQPLFVSGGDDYKIKVWNYKQRKCLFTLLGHLDYIRTTFFHHEYPWILSASDDQTIRVWNWQLALLSAHYVMCAQFHPSEEDLVVSASLDQPFESGILAACARRTCSGLARHDDIGGYRGGGMQGPGHTDLFGTTDAIVKHVLEGHDRGVNWVMFHPTIPSLLAPPTTVNKAWELDTSEATITSVSCAIFHPRQELMLSNSEDKSIRVWDMAKRTCHPVIEPVRCWARTMAWSSSSWSGSGPPTRRRFARLDLNTNKDQPVLQLPKKANYTTENAVLLGCRSAKIRTIPPTSCTACQETPPDSAVDAADSKRSLGLTANLGGPQPRFSTPGTGLPAVKEPDTVFAQKRALSSVKAAQVRQAIWSADMSNVALISKLTVTLESVRIKSAAWDDSAGVLLYTTANHIKYLLTSGDNGIIRTLDAPLSTVWDRECVPRVLGIDPHRVPIQDGPGEIKYEEVLHMVRHAKLVGQALIAYLQRKGYPEWRCTLSKTRRTRFGLAVECGNLDAALESARALDDKQWLGAAGRAGPGPRQPPDAASWTSWRKMMRIAEIRKGHQRPLPDGSALLGDVSRAVSEFCARCARPAWLASPPPRTACRRPNRAPPTIRRLAAADGDRRRRTLRCCSRPARCAARTSNWPLLTVTKDFFEAAMRARGAGGTAGAAAA